METEAAAGLARHTTLDNILEERIRVRILKLVSSDNDHVVASTSPTSSPSVKDEE